MGSGLTDFKRHGRKGSFTIARQAETLSLPSPSWIERRVGHRVATLSPIRFEWLTAGGDLFRARGMTRDISSTDVYSYTECPLSVGLEVAFDILFPAELVGREPVMFHCQGRVLRSENFQGRFGAAISIESHHLIDTAKFYRRANMRFVPASSVIAQYDGSRAAVRDLSPIGAFIEDRHPPPVGRKIELRFQGQEWNGDIDVEAIVRRVEPDTGMGVEFVVLTIDAARQLRELVRNGTSSE